MRTAQITRTTKETDIRLTLNLDGTGKSEIHSGVGFLDHMLTLFAKHGRFDLELTCNGDTEVDDHHSVEDIGIALGQAFEQALGDKRGIVRYGSFILPMDETLILAEEFFLGFVRNANLTLHLKQLEGKNSHHIIEGTFKSFGRTMKQAVAIDEAFRDEIPSTKGVL